MAYELSTIQRKQWEENYKADGETKVEDTWRRLARVAASVEKTKKLQDIWEKRYYKAFENFKFVPGGRIMANLGTSHKGASIYNCFIHVMNDLKMDYSGQFVDYIETAHWEPCLGFLHLKE